MTCKIAISCRVIDASSYVERRDAIAKDWCDLFNEMAWLPVIVPNHLTDATQLLEVIGVDGLILSGGNTLGSIAEPRAPGTVLEREKTEKQLLTYAVDKNLPVLGVCRGLQVINQFFGGDHTLRICSDAGHVGCTHTVKLKREVWTGLDEDGAIEVNSFHDDGVLPEQVAPDLEIFATSSDGVFVEGLIHKDKPIIAVQWHPERSNPSSTVDRKLLRSLFEAPKGLNEKSVRR